MNEGHKKLTGAPLYQCLVVYVANIVMYFFSTIAVYIESVLFIVKLIKFLFFSRLFCYRIIDSGAKIKIFNIAPRPLGQHRRLAEGCTEVLF